MLKVTKKARFVRLLALVATAALMPLGFACTASDGDSQNTQPDLAQVPGAICSAHLESAENANDPAQREESLIDYQHCVDEHMDSTMGADGADGDYGACYDIIEAVVRLQDDVDESLIAQLHEAYVTCVFDLVDGGSDGGNNGGPGDDRCDWLFDEADQRCEDEGCFDDFDQTVDECLEGPGEPPQPNDCVEIAYEVCGDPREDGPDGQGHDFENCIDEVVRECEGAPEPPNQCDDILREAEEVCGNGDTQNPDDQNPDGGQCWEAYERAFQDCHGEPEPPNQCDEILREAEEVCGRDGEQDPDGGQCWEEYERAYRACVGDTEPPNQCDEILREAEEVCANMGEQDPDGGQCWEEYERAFQDCHGEPEPPNQCDDILREAEEVCANMGEQDPNGGQCWEEYERAYRACLGDTDPGVDACLEEAIQRCEEQLGADGEPNQNDPDQQTFEACVEDAAAQCDSTEPPVDQCEVLLEEAREICADDAECWASFEAEFEACTGR